MEPIWGKGYLCVSHKGQKGGAFLLLFGGVLRDCAIAFYRNGNECFNAQGRLHGENPKKEPVFLLQNAIIFRLGNLWLMVRAVFDEGMPTDFETRMVLTHCYSPKDDMFYTYMAPLKQKPRVTYTTITMTDNEWLSMMRGMPSKGTIALDWSCLPTVIYEGRERIVPRLLLAVDARTGCIIKSEMLF